MAPQLTLASLLVLTTSFFALTCASTSAQAVADPAQGTVWDLKPLFSDNVAWERERTDVENSLPGLAHLKGTPGKDAESLQVALSRISQARQRLQRLHAYAQLKADEDTSIAENQARLQSITNLQGRFAEATAFLDPEILALGRSQIEAFEKADPALGVYRRQLEIILRRAPHTLGPEAEGVVAATVVMRRQPDTIHTLLTLADIPWPTIEVQGKVVKLEPEAYYTVLYNSDREVRRKAYDAYLSTLSSYQRTLGAVLSAYLSGPAFEAKVRHYPSSLALLVGDDAMPEETFRTLTAEADKAIPILKRYLHLRKQLLGVDELHFYDLFVPLITDKHQFQLSDGEDLILKALAPLGDDYVRGLAAGFRSNVMHATIQPNKAAGAYTNDEAYGTAPYVLTSFNGNYDSVSAVAHEWGHAMHSRLAQGAQPFESAEYSAFVADAPSLTNEMLLSDYMIAHAVGREDKILALSRAIDLLRGSYFGIVLYAQFELSAHQAADRGEALTGQYFRNMYCDLLKNFYGGPEGSVTVGDADCALWANVRAVYWDFYAYKYMTATSAAAYFVEGLEKNDTGLRSRYFELLKSGGSDDPYLLLKRAGFDAASPAAYQPMVRRLGHLVDALEAAVGRNPLDR
jgi:oligoendopeptidase F